MTWDEPVKAPKSSPSAANQLPPFIEVESPRPLAIPVAPHRGVEILVYGMLGLGFCLFFSIPAWQMGRSDLQSMERGLMDKSGHGLTKAGYVLGMIGMALILIPFAYFALFMIIGIIAHVGR